MRSPRIRSVGLSPIQERLLQKQREGMYTFASPTADHNYKRVFLCTSSEIRIDFCNAILKVAMPSIPLTVREVKVADEFIDRDAVNRQLAIGGPKPQNLRVDALFHVDMEDNRRDGPPQTRTGTFMSRPAYILGEMQVDPQHFGARLMSYVSKVHGALPIDVKQDVIPAPVYAAAFCMWACEQLVKRSESVRSTQLDAVETRRFTEISYSSVFLGKLIKVKNKNRTTLDTNLLTGQTALKEKVAVFFGKENWETLELDEKRVYLWLEFLSFAHLMTEEHKNESLACLNGDPAVNIFNAAYDAVRLNFKGVSMEQIRENYPDIYGYEEERFEKEQTQAKLEKAETYVRETVEVYINMIKVADNNLDLIQKLIDPIPLGLQERVCEQLVNHHMVTGVIQGVLENKIKTLRKDRAARMQGQMLSTLRQANGHLEEAEMIVSQIEKQLSQLTSLLSVNMDAVSARGLSDMLEAIGGLESQIQESRQGLNAELQESWSTLENEFLWRYHIQALRDFDEKALNRLLSSPEPQGQKYDKMKKLWLENPFKALHKMKKSSNMQKAAIEVLREFHEGAPDMLLQLKCFETVMQENSARWNSVLEGIEMKRSECLGLLKPIIGFASPTRSPKSGQQPGYSTPQRGQSTRKEFGTPRGDDLE
jgi:hypothetical protein